MFVYRNTKTGATVYSETPVSGGDWVEVKEDKTKRTTAKKKGSDAK